MAESLGCPANQDHGKETTWEMLGRAALLPAPGTMSILPGWTLGTTLVSLIKASPQDWAFRKICLAGIYSKLPL